MPYVFSRREGVDHPEKVLIIDEYVNRLDSGTLSPKSQEFGWVTYVRNGTEIPPEITEEEYLEGFRHHWIHVLINAAIGNGLSLDELREYFKIAEGHQGRFIHGLPMAKGLSSVPEDVISPVESPLTPASREERRARLDNLRGQLRPPPFHHLWSFWFDKHADAAATTPVYQSRVELMLDVADTRDFFQFANNTPLNRLKIRDSIHLFKRTVKPVWEDPRNVRGGSWTFRVNKAKSEKFWMELMLLAVGETLQEAVTGQKGEDICGVTISPRFSSHLIQVWNRDGTNQKTIDAILATVLANLSPDIKPADTDYYYKRHSEHKGFDATAAAKIPLLAQEQKIEATPIEPREMF
ncbi:MAG: hypothetical protein M1814_003034 [Vezdaea aestivalis]|nr:MAG: hypothetical protein M1814_003034 [Vezdaea aestivalis]